MRRISTNYVTSKKLTTLRRLPSTSVTLSPTALHLPTVVAGVRLPPVQSLGVNHNLGVNHSVNFLGRGAVHVLVAGLSPGQIVPRLPAPHAMIYATCVRDPLMSTTTL